MEGKMSFFANIIIKIKKKIPFIKKNVENVTLYPYTKDEKRCYNKLTNNGRRGNDMVYKALDIAKYIVHYCTVKKEQDISNLQLQKILYYVQGYFMKKYRLQAYNEEIYNWTYGPVTPAVYYEYNQYGGRKILIADEDIEAIDIVAKNKHDRRLIDKVIDKCLTLSVGELVNKTHSEAPWSKTGTSDKIPIRLIDDYFDHNNPLDLELKD